jgi:hypothetical protein
MDMYEASISKVLFDSLGITKATDLLIDKVERQLDAGINRTDYMQTMYEEPSNIRLVYEKRKGCALV